MRVIVWNIGGVPLEFDLAGESTVSTVKKHLAKAWDVREESLFLVLGSTVLLDSERIGYLERPPFEALSLTSVFSMDGLYEDLHSADTLRQASALADMVRLGRRCRHTAAMVLGACAAEGCADVRRAALSALVQIAARGDGYAVNVAGACLEDECAPVRRAAVAALRRLADRGDQHALAAVAPRLEHPKAHTRRAALRALARLAGRGDACVTAAVRARLQDEDEDADVRFEAATALAQIK